MADKKQSEKPNISVDEDGKLTSNVDVSEDTPENEVKIDEAINDILRGESDDELKKQDEVAEKAVVMKQGPWERFKNFQRDWWANPRKKWGTIAAILVVIIALFAVPFTRYEIVGLFVREKITVQAVDDQSGAPVSGALVVVGSEKAETDAAGKAILHVHAGSKHLQVTKKYYTGTMQSVLVTLSPGSNTFKAKLVATGRLVKVKVVNKIGGKPVANVKITAGGASAKTDKNGMATVVLASGATTQQASISLNGYNTAKVTIDANGNLAKNTLSITPAGKLYFLSNLSGTIDVVKTNLDGTDRQTVLAGTGNEDPNSTSLLASRDWKYLALLSKRAGDNASVYAIDTTNGDKLTTIDSGSVSFSLIGWSGDRLVYKVDRSDTVSEWQSNQLALKSYDPTSGHTLLLDQTQAVGTNQYDYSRQFFGNAYLMDDHVVYSKGWQSGQNGNATLNGKQAELDRIDADGSNHRTIKTFTPGQYNNPYGGYDSIGLTTQLYEPNGLYVWFGYHGQDDFYDYEDSKISDDPTMTPDSFYALSYDTYLQSPSGNQTFWADQRDGKNVLFTGNQDAKNQKQVGSLTDYSPYAWFTDSYILVSKNKSELYIMPTSGGTPLKITDYYKPAINYYGYGGGYGGL